MLLPPLRTPDLVSAQPTAALSQYIDLRSDTVTLPTEEMRRAMYEAKLGDDVYGEDPTVIELEEQAARTMGKETGIFVPTGTMGNQIAVKLHTHHGQEIIAEARSHIFDWELSMAAWISGCLVRPVAAPRGLLSWDSIEPHLRPVSAYAASTGLVCLESSHNMGGGFVYDIAALQRIFDGCRQCNIPVHLDGARIFNAAICLGCDVREIASRADTVMFCLSKGLCAPAGSLLVGPKDLIARARILRKQLGGGMRQSGVLAAAGLVALNGMVDRLREDHENARDLARGMSGIPGIRVLNENVMTNVVLIESSGTRYDATKLSFLLRERGVLINGTGKHVLRALTHHGIDAEMCQRACEAVASIVAG